MRVAPYLALGSILLSSCAHRVNDEQEIGTLAASSLPTPPDYWATLNSISRPVEMGWIDRIGDPVLRVLVDEAIANNRDLRAAAASVDESRALAAQARAALVPAVDYSATAGRQGNLNGEDTGSYSAGLQWSWEADLWGRVASNKEAAALTAYSAEADYKYSQHAIAAAVAQSYFVAIESGLQVDVAQKSLDTVNETDRIVAVRRELGDANGQDVALSKSDLANAHSSLIDAQNAQRSAIRSLEVLLGRYPSAELEARRNLPSAPPPPAVGVPAELLERRPDLVASKISLAAAFNSLRASEAARLPTISITGSIQGNSNQVENIFDPQNILWEIFGNLLGPLIDGGTRQAEVDQASAQQVQAAENYAKLAIDAYQEVEGNIDALRSLSEQAVYLQKAADESNKALRIAQIRYREGEAELLDVLTIQSDVVAADQALVSIERQCLDAWVALNLSLGGQW